MPALLTVVLPAFFSLMRLYRGQRRRRAAAMASHCLSGPVELNSGSEAESDQPFFGRAHA